MSRYAALTAALCLMVSVPAWGGDSVRPRLVPGSGSLGLPSFSADTKTDVLSTGGFSLGTLSAPAAAQTGDADAAEGLSLGGYASYGADWLRLSSSIKGGQGSGSADLTASQPVSPWGVDGTAALSLGYQWTQVGGFSLNPAQLGVTAGAWGQANDLSLSLSFTHDVTPSFSMGGFAAASRGESADNQPSSGLHFGAGLELKF